MISCMYLETVYGCNLRCKYCFFDWGKEIKTMSLEIVDKAVELGKDLGVAQYSIQGGEPLLAPDLIKEVVTRVNGNRVTVTTNGTIDFSFLCNNVGLRVSLDNWPSIGDYVRGKGDKVIQNLMRAIPKTDDLQLCVTVVPDNLFMLSEFVKWWYCLGLKHVVVFPVVESNWNDDSIEKYKTEMRRMREYGFNVRTDDFCGRLNSQVYVTYDGNLYPCHMARRFEKELKEKLGLDVKIGTVHDGVNFTKLSEYNKHELANKCTGCDRYFRCQVCWISAYIGRGSFPDDVACAVGST